MPIRVLGLLVAGFLLLPVSPAGAQQLGLAAGYVKVPGQIGDQRSDHGLATRAGVYLGGRSLISVGLEVGFDVLNRRHSDFTQPNCLLPSGGTGACHFKTRVRDRDLSVSLVARVQARGGSARPYLLLGLGVMDVRTHDRTDVTDDNGNRLENFSHDGTTGDGAGVGHFGAGVAWFPGSGRLALTAEGRVTPVLHNYSGGPQLDLSPSLLAGVRWGGR